VSDACRQDATSACCGPYTGYRYDAEADCVHREAEIIVCKKGNANGECALEQPLTGCVAREDATGTSYFFVGQLYPAGLAECPAEIAAKNPGTNAGTRACP
jgi:hypothetical protein